MRKRAWHVSHCLSTQYLFAEFPTGLVPVAVGLKTTGRDVREKSYV